MSGVATVTSVILVTTAILVVGFDWKLNILESVAITLAIGLSVDFSLHYAVKATSSGTGGVGGGTADDVSGVVRGLESMAIPVTMAAVTTASSGLCLIPTRLLAYIRIGTFIVVLMTVSWTFSTFFLHALLQVLIKP